MQEMVSSIIGTLPSGVIFIVIGFFALTYFVISEVEEGYSLVAVIMSWNFMMFGILIVSHILYDFTTFFTVFESGDLKLHSGFFIHLLLPTAILTIMSVGIGIIVGGHKLKKAEQA